MTEATSAGNHVYPPASASEHNGEKGTHQPMSIPLSEHLRPQLRPLPPNCTWHQLLARFDYTTTPEAVHASGIQVVLRPETAAFNMTRSTSLFPRLVHCSRLGAKDYDYKDAIYDVKYFPYPTAGNDHIFAATGLRDTIVFRPVLDDPQSPYEVLRWFRDEDVNASLNSIAWTVDPETNDPLLCVAGEHPKHIKILNVRSGEADRTLAGHGQDVNDIAVSPLSSQILASGSGDHTIRLWHLGRDYTKRPLAAIFHGGGHKQPILGLTFHPSGKWLISGGMDTAVNLWAVPDLPNDGTGTDKPTVVYYPHFHTTEIHHNFVDCFQWYGDLVLSRCSTHDSVKQNQILLWKIDGFSSNQPVPADPPIPSPGVYTRSAFTDARPYFQRLLTFDMPWTSTFYTRFGFYHGPDMRPILVAGNEKSDYNFWDLERLEEGYDATESAQIFKKPRGRHSKRGASRGSDLSRLAFGSHAQRAGSVVSSSSSTRQSLDQFATSTTSAISERKYVIDDPFTPIKPHHTVTLPSHLHDGIATRSIAWSTDGQWCVSAADKGYLAIFHRDVD